MGCKPPAAVVRISKNGRHDLGTAAPSSTKHLPCKGDREVRPSSRNWSSWSSGRVQLGLQSSYPHASLELQRRRPPCARESSCVRARLPPWQNVAAVRQAPGLLHVNLYFTKFPPSRPPSCPIDQTSSPLFSAIYRIFLQSVDIHPPT